MSDMGFHNVGDHLNTLRAEREAKVREDLARFIVAMNRLEGSVHNYFLVPGGSVETAPPSVIEAKFILDSMSVEIEG